MKDKRPENLQLTTLHLPPTAWASILHRISGALLFVGVALLLWLLDASLNSQASFEALRGRADSLLVTLLLWGVLSALAYHLVAGVRHLLMDLGCLESLKGGRNSAWATIVIGIVLVLALGVWLW